MNKSANKNLEFVESEDNVAGIKARLKVIYSDRINNMKKQQLTMLVKYGIRKANEYQIKTEDDVTRFIEAKLMLGQALEKNKKFKSILNNKNLTGSQKVSKIEEIMLFQD